MDEQALREALRSEAAEQPFDPAAVDRAVERGRSHRRRRRTTLLAAVPLVALTVAGAGAAALTWLPGDPPTTRSAGDAAVARPVQLLTQSTDPEVYMMAHLTGVLVVADHGCIAVDLGADRVVPVAWPLAWTAAREDDGRAVVYDASGVPRAREGSSVGLGGGSIDNDVEWSPIDSAHPCTLGSTRVFRVSGGAEPIPLR